jgi:hypothetical protein
LFQFVANVAGIGNPDLRKETDMTEQPTAPHHDEEDVPAALARETTDGPGTDALPPSDFDSFAEPDVEKES